MVITSTKENQMYEIVFKEKGEIVRTNGPYISYGEAHRNLREMDLMIPSNWWAHVEEIKEVLTIEESLIDYNDNNFA